MRRVLVTGASGFIGRAVTQRLALENDFCVYAVVSGRREVSLGQDVTVMKTDLLCPDQVAALMGRVKADICVHLAWELPGNDAFQQSAKNLDWLRASIDLLQQFVKHGGERFIFAGSSSEYGAWEGGMHKGPYAPLSSLYGVSKRAFTEAAQKFSEQQGFQFACARYFSIYGEYDVRPARAVPYAIRQLLAGEQAICRSPNSIWDYLYVGDAAEATTKLVKSPMTGVVNIASGVPRSMREVFQTTANLCGRPELVTFLNQDRPGQTLVANIDCLRDGIKFSPGFSFEEGMQRTISWWKRQRAKPNSCRSGQIYGGEA